MLRREPGAWREKAAKNPARPARRRRHRSCLCRGMLRSVLIPHAAELLGVSRRTVYYRIRAGTLKTVRTLGGSQRVLMESIEAALRAERRRRKRHGAHGTARRSGVRWSANRVLRVAEGVVLTIR